MNYKNNKTISTIIILIFISFLWLFMLNDSFFLWAFERHQNTLSWFIRPILLIPICYFAYNRNLNGILMSILALFTSMFWFPIPDVVDPQVSDFLLMEQKYIQTGFNLANIIGIFSIIIYFSFVIWAFWKRSLIWGIWVIFLGLVGKIIWSLYQSPEAWASIIPFAVWWFIIIIISTWIYFSYNKKP